VHELKAHEAQIKAHAQFVVENKWFSRQISHVLPHGTVPTYLFPV
jgi:hypothetical protein